MNILIPHNWLLEHLETAASAQDIARELSLAGPSVERIVTDSATQEPVYDIEVTTNRVDAMSVRGIAREAAVILTQAGWPSKLKPLKLKKIQAIHKLPLPKISNDPNLSRRVMCVVLAGVNQAPTPNWMAERLVQAGMNVHHAAIDITNYITHELGHPCHAFDYDKLVATGAEINVVTAEANETFTTLDGESFVTLGGEVVFKNGAGQIIDLPSIKGTLNTSVSESTSNILLLMESINAEKVRFASMTHSIRTIAAQLMEKNVDPHLMDLVLQRGVELYTSICSAEAASQIYDEFPDKQIPQPVVVDLATITQYLGIELEATTITHILSSLECQVVVSGNEQVITVQPPTFRPDLAIPADIVEEIARIYGYHNLPSQLMATRIPTTYPREDNFALENQVKQFLANIGWQEIYAYSLVGEELAIQSGYQLSDHLKLQNPLTEDRVYLRRSLIPSLVEAIRQNPMQSSFYVFELAHVYHPQPNELPQEQLMLSLVAQKSLREVRGDLETLFEQLHLDNFKFRPDPHQQLAEIWTDQTDAANTHSLLKLGRIKMVDKSLVAAEIDWATLLKVSQTHPHYQPISPIPELVEDMTFKLVPKTHTGEVLNTINKSSKLVKRVNFVNQYQQNITVTIHYHRENKPISSTELEPIRKKIVKNVLTKHQAQLVGTV